MLAAQFQALLRRADTFGLGVCNGCQMFAELADIIPGAQDWPRFTTNQSERFEARLSMVEVLESPSLFFAGMAGSRLPIAVAHGEGYANFKHRGDAAQAIAAMRFVDNHGQPTEQYPFNPNGSAGGLTAVTTADGRFTAMMPHPERVFRNIQMSWTSRRHRRRAAPGCRSGATRASGSGEPAAAGAPALRLTSGTIKNIASSACPTGAGSFFIDNPSTFKLSPKEFPWPEPAC